MAELRQMDHRCQCRNSSSPSPTFQVAWENWLKSLSGERRLSGETVESYERDTRQFLQFMTGHCGGRPALRIFARCDRRICAASGCAAQRRAGPRTLARGLAGIRSLLRFEKRGLVNAAGATALRAPKQPKSLPKPLTVVDAPGRRAGRATCGGALDCRAQRRGPDAPLRPWPAHFEALGLKGGDLQPGEAILRVVGKGSKTRLAPVLPLASQAVAEYRLCPYHLGADAPLFRGAKGGPLSPAIVQREMVKLRSALNLPQTATPHALRHSCNPSIGSRRRPAHDPGTSWPRQSVDDANLYRRRYGASARHL
jgi:integrase/recombinase XerC